MSLYVLDSSVAVKWVLPETNSVKALALRDDILNQVHDVIAPEVFASEVAHALTKAERQRIILVGEAATHLTDIMDDNSAGCSTLDRHSAGVSAHVQIGS